MSFQHTPGNYLQTPRCSNRLYADSSVFGWLAPWEGVDLQFNKDPFYYKYAGYNMGPHYNLCNKPPKKGYGLRAFSERPKRTLVQPIMKKKKVVRKNPYPTKEGFDFAHSVNDFTPTHAKWAANGQIIVVRRKPSKMAWYPI